jgi:type III secretory pathway lipoprotein EscJ
MRALLPISLVLACGAPAPDRRPAGRSAPDKEAMFGDAGLVPTREGERARTEVALAGEIHNALAVLPEVARVRIDVELGDAEEEPTGVVVAAELRGDASVEAVFRDAAGKIVRAIAGPVPDETLVVLTSSTPADGDTPAPALPLLLALALLGLGVSMGVTGERARAVLRSR